MSDGNGSSNSAEMDHDTLPMGHEVARLPLLRMIVDSEWEGQEPREDGQDKPNEAYWCDIEDARLCFERRGRKWQGRLVPQAGGETRETVVGEDIGRVAREFQQLLKQWRKS